MRFVFCFLLFLVLISCQSRPKAPEVVGDSAIAQIDEQIILASEFMKQIQRLEAKTPQILSTHLQKKDLLEQWINVELLSQAALDAGFMNDFRFKTKLAEAYTEDLSERARQALSLESIRSFYENNRRRFDQISARHILFKTAPGMPEKEKIEKFRELEKLRTQLLENPSAFSEFARRHSEDTNARQGGDLGFFSYDEMVPEFSKAAFALKHANEISPIVSTPFGYHLIQLQDSRRGFEIFRRSIENHMLRESKQQLLEKELKDLRATKNIQIFEDELLKLSPLPSIIQEDPEDVIPKDFRKETDPEP